MKYRDRVWSHGCSLMGLRRKGWTVDGLDPIRRSGADATRTNREWTRMNADGDGGGSHPSGYDGRSDNRQLVTGWASGNPPPGIPTGFCHKARGCAAEALPRVNAQHINNPEGVVPWHHRARLVADARNRKNGQRHHGFSMSQPTLCVVIHTFVASAQPRCGCCTPPKRTRGCAAEALPRVNAQHIN
ncbi:MAG: hypothetical protein WCR20_06240, partial [Verrucomicrobiota bacterium]